MFGFQFLGLGFWVNRTAALDVRQSGDTWLPPSRSSPGRPGVRLHGDQFIPAHRVNEFQPHQPLYPVMPEAQPITPGLHPALGTFAFSDPVENCPDFDRPMLSNE